MGLDEEAGGVGDALQVRERRCEEVPRRGQLGWRGRFVLFRERLRRYRWGHRGAGRTFQRLLDGPRRGSGACGGDGGGAPEGFRLRIVGQAGRGPWRDEGGLELLEVDPHHDLLLEAVVLVVVLFGTQLRPEGRRPVRRHC